MQDESTKKDRNLKVFHAESAAAGIEHAGDSYQAASLIASGANGQSVAMLSSVIHMVASLLYIKVPNIIDKIGSRRKAVLLLGFLDAITWVPLVVIFFFVGPINPNWLILFWVINLIPALLAAPIRDNWLVDIVPANSMGRYLGVRSAISNTAYLVTFFFMGRTLDMYQNQVFTGFTFVFLTAFTGAAGCFSLYFLTSDQTDNNKKTVKLSIKNFVSETKSQGIGRFILFCALVWFSVELSVPFFSVYILKDLHFSYTVYTSLFLASYLARIISVTIWGKYSDKHGNLKAITIAAPLIFVYRFLMLTTTNVIGLFFIQMLNGAMWAGFDLCSYNLIYKAAPAEKRLQYIIYHRALMTFAMSLGALGGIALVNIVPPIGGHNILGLFLLSGIIGFAVIAIVLPTLKNIGSVARTQPDKAPEAQPWTAPALGDNLRRGLYHSPQAWVQYNNRAKLPALVSSVQTTDQGLLRRSQAWKLFSSPFGTPQPIITNLKTDVLTTRPVIVNKPQFWTRFTNKSTSVKTIADVKKSKTGAFREGLFNKPEVWIKYNGKANIAELTGMRNKKIKMGDGLYHNPGSWNRSSAETNAAKPLTARSYAKIMSEKQGLYHKPEVWSDFSLRCGSPAYASTFSRFSQTSSRPALLNRPQAWTQYAIKKYTPDQTIDYSKKKQHGYLKRYAAYSLELE